MRLILVTGSVNLCVCVCVPQGAAQQNLLSSQMVKGQAQIRPLVLLTHWADLVLGTLCQERGKQPKMWFERPRTGCYAQARALVFGFASVCGDSVCVECSI
mmetsp:Transcript_51840/g.86363  ORF Transcript_51840/g.86363 Transcript_51840/m.86363 type:complete len:101 (-) Transcript_51840:247-549(-)